MKCVQVALATWLALAPVTAAPDAVEAVTRPSIDITLSFLEAGKVERVHVKQGDRVVKGGWLVQLDAAPEIVRLDQLRGQAENQSKIKMAAAQQQQKSQLLSHLNGLQNAVSPLELARAQLDASLAALTRDQENFEHAQAQLRFREAQIRIERLSLVSPISGMVEELHVHHGQIVDRLEKVVRLVSVDPLWVDVATPLAEAKALQVGAPASVEFRDGQVLSGKLVHIGAFADAGSDTLKVRLEVANAAGRPAGEHVKVRWQAPEKK